VNGEGERNERIVDERTVEAEERSVMTEDARRMDQRGDDGEKLGGRRR